MNLLIINLGTSDLTVHLNGYYIPIGFGRKEPNLTSGNITPTEQEKWNSQETIVREQLCPQLGMELPQKLSVREISEKIWQNYENWKNHLYFGRIIGILQTAQKQFSVDKVYFFVSNQATTENPQGHPQDTCYIAQILIAWLNDHRANLFYHPIEFQQYKIPNFIQLTDYDAVLDEYYRFFQKLPSQEKLASNDLILISTKGGTTPMQVALRLQAIATYEARQILLDPHPTIENILYGKPSPCQVTFYWRYARSQKYNTVQQLLERWDFEGANQILKKWSDRLQELSQKIDSDSELPKSRDCVNRVSNVLQIAVAYLNLDIQAVQKYLPSNDSHTNLKWLHDIQQNYHPVLNLYTQCRLYWELERMADFLSRLGGFCEEILHYIIRGLDGEQYFYKSENPYQWDLKQPSDRFWSQFRDIEKHVNGKVFNWEWRPNSYYRLRGRYSKRNFITALIRDRNAANETGKIETWETLEKQLQQLDYWIDKRNELMHGAKGISKETMHEILKYDQKYTKDRDLQKNVKNTCQPEEILPVMHKVMYRTLQLLFPPNQQWSHKFVGEQALYYIYSDIKEWTLATLFSEGL